MGVWIVLGISWMQVMEAIEYIDTIVQNGDVDVAFVVVPI